MVIERKLNQIDVEIENNEWRFWQKDIYLRLKRVLAKQWVQEKEMKNAELMAKIEQQLKTLEEEKLKYGF